MCTYLAHTRGRAALGAGRTGGERARGRACGGARAERVLGVARVGCSPRDLLGDQADEESADDDEESAEDEAGRRTRATTTALLSVNPAVSRQRDYIYIYIADNLARLYRMRG